MVSRIPKTDMTCLSKDEKPTEFIDNGQIMIEMDTGNSFIFDFENKKWWPM